MPTALNPSLAFFTDVRRILADARHTPYIANIHQFRTLTTIYDTLLPKVLCWELSVVG